MKYDMEAGRPFNNYGWNSKKGQSSTKIICPFCDFHFVAYLWSLYGSGKKCPQCGAKHCGSESMAYPVQKVAKT